MAKYTINKGYNGEKTIEADGYYLANGYWNLVKTKNGDDVVVYTIAAAQVHTIELESE